MKGWGPKSSVFSWKPRESNFFGGISRDFAGISRKHPKSLRKKSLGSIFGPYFWRHVMLLREWPFHSKSVFFKMGVVPRLLKIEFRRIRTRPINFQCSLQALSAQGKLHQEDTARWKFRKAPDTFKFLRHVMRAILSGRPNSSHRCVSLKESPLKPVHFIIDQNINRANLYENEMV